MDTGLKKPTICKGYELGILYDKFGYTIQLLERKHGVEIYNMMIDKRVDRIEYSTIENDTRISVLKAEIRQAVDSSNYNSVGVFKDDVLIGISFNNIIDLENQPWLGNFMVKKGFYHTRAPLVLMNYILNHLYDDYVVQLASSLGNVWDKEIRQLPIEVGYSVFKDGVKERIKKLCGE